MQIWYLGQHNASNFTVVVNVFSRTNVVERMTWHMYQLSRMRITCCFTVLTAVVEYVSSAHGLGTLGCSGRARWLLSTYLSANGKRHVQSPHDIRTLKVGTFFCYTVEYVSSAHGWGTLECSEKGGWALTTYLSANGM